jgi:hypothetical protein
MMSVLRVLREYGYTWIFYSLGKLLTFTSCIPGNELYNPCVRSCISFTGYKELISIL